MRDDIRIFFDHHRSSNSPTPALSSQLEHLLGTTLASATSPTAPPDHCSRPTGPNQSHTPDCEEPVLDLVERCTFETFVKHVIRSLHKRMYSTPEFEVS